jgi:hypothetical protein
VTGYRPMTLADLGDRLAGTADGKGGGSWSGSSWRNTGGCRKRFSHRCCVTSHPIGDQRWDTLLAALAEHLAAQHDLAPLDWAERRALQRPWFPAELRIQRADALVWAPAAFRKHGVYLSATDLEGA